jgi:hypothetical protein
MNGSAIIRKIQKLLDLAKDQEGTSEGEAAGRIAAKMMREHAISMAQVDVAEREAADPIIKSQVKIETSVWRRSLANIIARHCNCRLWYTSRRGSGTYVTYCGHKTDVEIAQYLYEICDRQIYEASRAYRKTLADWQPKRGLCNDFRRSAVAGLNSKLEAIREAGRTEDAQGTSLVISRFREVEEYVAANQKLRKGSSSRYYHNDAGYAAGRKVSLHAGVGGSAKKTRMIA